MRNAPIKKAVPFGAASSSSKSLVERGNMGFRRSLIPALLIHPARQKASVYYENLSRDK
jgi:hypothetical protein